METLIHKKISNKNNYNSYNKSSCSNPSIKNILESSLETSSESFYSVGAHIANKDNLPDWPGSNFNNPKIINFKLMPIITLFDARKLNYKRITDNNGFELDVDGISSWMLPRYAVLMSRCKTLPNNRISDSGSSCVPCLESQKPSDDGLQCEGRYIYIYIYIRSISQALRHSYPIISNRDIN